MDLVNLFWRIVLTAPLLGMVTYDDNGNRLRTLSPTLCETIRFEAQIKTNGVYWIQISESPQGGWENIGARIVAPTTNIQTLAVVTTNNSPHRVFRLMRK